MKASACTARSTLAWRLVGREGLIVPVIKDADRLSLLGLAQGINDLAKRARAKKLQPDEVKGGTFTSPTTASVARSLHAHHQPAAMRYLGWVQFKSALW